MFKKIGFVILVIFFLSGCACWRCGRRLKRSVGCIEQNFSEIDTNHDGLLSLEELNAAKK